MYKVMLVDDEAVVREGLRNIIDWPRHGFELAGDFTNGRDALEAIETLRPDLVLTDINMPFMNGLELSEQILQRYPYIKIIILTGYDQFEYAQQALRLKIHDFILKPITASETRALLDKVHAEMEEEKRRGEDVGRLYSQLNQSLPLLRERFLERLAATGAGARNMAERLAYFGIPDLKPPYLVTLYDYDGAPRHSDASEQDMELLHFAGFNIIEEIISREGGVVFRTREDRIAALIGGQPESLLHELALRTAEEARRHIERYLGYTVTAAIGRAAARPHDLPDSYKSASAALDYRFQYGKNRVLSILDLEGKETAPASVSLEWSRLLAGTIRTGSAAEIRSLIGPFIAGLKESHAPLDVCYLQIQKVIILLMNTMQEMGIDETRIVSRHRMLFSELYRLGTLDEVGQWLEEIAVGAIETVSDNRSQTMRNQIGQAIAYIEEHYADERITLQDICRHVLMSTSYFSTVFKQQTGETFVEYLTRIRIGKAKELVCNTPLKLYEIAAKVGYADPNYFSISFKKHTGLTPREYREKSREQP